MPALEAALVILLLAAPLYWLVHRELAKESDPKYLREHGVIIVSEKALQAHSPTIGEYRGRPVWGSVRFMGMDYRFDRVIDPSARESLGPRELFLDPGLVYITD